MYQAVLISVGSPTILGIYAMRGGAMPQLIAAMRMEGMASHVLPLLFAPYCLTHSRTTHAHNGTNLDRVGRLYGNCEAQGSMQQDQIMQGTSKHNIHNMVNPAPHYQNSGHYQDSDFQTIIESAATKDCVLLDCIIDRAVFAEFMGGAAQDLQKVSADSCLRDSFLQNSCLQDSVLQDSCLRDSFLQNSCQQNTMQAQIDTQTKHSSIKAQIPLHTKERTAQILREYGLYMGEGDTQDRALRIDEARQDSQKREGRGIRGDTQKEEIQERGQGDKFKEEKPQEVILQEGILQEGTLKEDALQEDTLKEDKLKKNSPKCAKYDRIGQGNDQTMGLCISQDTQRFAQTCATLTHSQNATATHNLSDLQNSNDLQSLNDSQIQDAPKSHAMLYASDFYALDCNLLEALELFSNFAPLQAVYYARGVGSLSAIKLTHVFLHTLALSMNLTLYATNSFYFSQTNEIKAFAKMSFFSSLPKGVAISDECAKEVVRLAPSTTEQTRLYLPPTLIHEHFQESCTPLYVTPAVF